MNNTLRRIVITTENGTETVWAEPLGQDRFRVANSPFFAFDISLNDIISAGSTHDDSSPLHFHAVVERGGHSNYRVYSDREFSSEDPAFVSWWGKLEALGCTFEGYNAFLLAIDVPPGADIHQVYEILETGERAGVWKFEEAHCGHPL